MRDPFKRFNSGRAVLFLVALIALYLTGAVLKITASINLPFIMAVLLALVMTPFINFWMKFKIPRFIPIIFAGFLLIAVIIALGEVFFISAQSILRIYPRYEARMTEIFIWLSQYFDLSYDEQLSFIQNLWAQSGIRTQIQIYTFTLSNSFLNFIKDTVMISLFLVFLLFEAVFIKEKLNVAFEGKRAGHIWKISIEIMQQVSRYLSIKFIISVINGVVVAFLLKLVGLEFAVVWGIFQFILNFIPTLGTIAISIVVSLFSLIQFWPDPLPVFLTILIMVGVNMILGSIIDPKVTGDGLGLTPLVIFLSLMLWGWIWGFAGMVIAVPMTVIIRIVCDNVPVLEPISILLGSRRAVQAKKAEYEKEAESDAEGKPKGNVTGE